jgi:hypothetical protein
MQNKKLTMVAMAILAVVAFVFAYVFVYQKQQEKKIIGENPGVSQEDAENSNQNINEYAKMQNQFLMDMPCGVTEFDSPYVKTVQCESQKMQKGELVDLKFKGRIVDEQGESIENAKVAVNNGDSFYTDKMGFYEGNVLVDSNKKLINLNVDKFGYSPIRKIYNALDDTGDGVQAEIPQVFFANDIKMRSADVQKISLNNGGDTLISSKKYPGVSLMIPAGGLVNAAGETVAGEITAEMSYLDPENPEDRDFVPGFSGSMVGIDRNGNQVTLKSGGMVFFHLKQDGSDEILQPKKGNLVTIRQPLPDHRLNYYQALKESSNSNDIELELYKDEEGFNKMLYSGKMFFNYWYFNQKTGLWEDWPVKDYVIDLKNETCIMKVPRLY